MCIFIPKKCFYNSQKNINFMSNIMMSLYSTFLNLVFTKKWVAGTTFCYFLYIMQQIVEDLIQI